MKKFVIFILIIGLLLILRDLFAGTGTSGADFLNIQVSGRPIALGGAYVGVIGGPETLYWNPASIRFTKQPELSGMYNNLYGDLNFEYIGYVHPVFNIFSIGANFSFLGTEILGAEAWGDATENIRYSSWVGTIGSAFPLFSEKFSAGAALKLIYQSLSVPSGPYKDNYVGSSPAFDVGALYFDEKIGLGIGISVQNIGASIGYTEKKDPLPILVRFGASYEIYDWNLLLTAELNNRDPLALGVEYRLYGFSIRAGYSTGYDYGFSGGAGYNMDFPFLGMGMKLDYAYRYMGSMGNSHSVSFSTYFGKKAPVLVIKETKAKDIFTAMIPYYHKSSEGIVSVIIKNEYDKEINNVKVTTIADEYMNTPSETLIDSIQAKSEYEINIPLTFNDKVFSVSSDKTVSVKVVAKTSVSQEKDIMAESSCSLKLIKINSIQWKEPLRIGAFITHQDKVVEKLCDEVIKQSKELRDIYINRTITDAMLIFNAIVSKNVIYKKDPGDPYRGPSAGDDVIDFVQFPRQTLERGTGDCDDCAVLYSACLEQVGIKTAIIDVPGHVFVAFNSGLTVEECYDMDVPSKNIIEINGQAWIPVETTAFSQGFTSAWIIGASEFKKAKDSYKIIKIEEAWAKGYEPCKLP